MNFPKEKYFVSSLIWTAVLGIIVFILLVGSSSKELSLAAYADKVIERCNGEVNRQNCYDREIPRLMNRISMRQAFEVTKLVQDKDSSFRFCHVVGHKLSAEEVKRNTSRWIDIVTTCPSGLCSNGCLHGGLQEKFREETLTEAQIEELKPELQNVCEKRTNWEPTELERASCYHALGHLAMYIYNADIPRASALCREIVQRSDSRDYSAVCFDGVFMQIFQPLEPEDFALVKGKQPSKERAPQFCESFGGQERIACLIGSWPLFHNEIRKPAGLVSFCELQNTDLAKSRCFDSLVYVLTVQFNFNTDILYDFCSRLPTPRKEECFGSVASRMIATDNRNIQGAVEFCSRTIPVDKGDACFGRLVRDSDRFFHVESQDFLKLCHSLPNNWMKKCLDKYPL